ncbi:hypothetical protein HW115_03685 [Verrucomicrobiaceae bacterium N1E253]|uniref:D-lyxose ketol-isomerase n=1 Tax=Oceaniferula marina TaxID=2748318 RepID=A0A851GAC0_9BACT|nr:hypothetical protein [Oceaniferula marina]NWK54698.1 hypothetical protein [Oceaniferula marina]
METTISRRAFVASALSAAGGAIVTGCKSSESTTSNQTTSMTNSDFYNNGEFDADKAKQAYFDMMKRLGCPTLEQYKGDLLWAIDFGLGDFASAGMGGVFWANENHEKGGYLGHEIFLLPGQMIVEHAHVACSTCPPKRESWLVRHGSVYSFSVQDEPKGFPEGCVIPESQRDIATVNSAILVKEGEVDHLNKAEAKHFIMAGPEGAVVTEFATFHDNEGLRFTNPNVKF